MSTEIIEVIQGSELEPQTANSIQDKLLPFFEQANEWKEKAEGLVVTDADQKDLMKQAREARLALKNIRVEANKTRKALKEDSLRYGRAVQGVYNVIEYMIAPIEKHLQEQEDFVKIQEEKALAQLREDREKEVELVREYIPYGIDFGPMNQADFDKLLNGAKAQQQAKFEADRKAEADRLAEQEAARIERERVEKENKELREAAAAREAELRKERDRVEAERKAEQEAANKRLAEERAERDRVEAELAAKRRAEADRLEREKQAKEAAEKEAKAAQALPDKEKLRAFADSIASLSAPALSSPSMVKILSKAKSELAEVAYRINKSIK